MVKYNNLDKNDLPFLGIEYKILSKKELNSPEEFGNTVSKPDTEELIEVDDDGDFTHEDSEIQVKRTKTFFTKEDIMIDGNLAIAELVDFLINQKDRNSYAILPEIFSPGPFIHGTLRSNSMTFSGACKGSNNEISYQLKIVGIIFPESIWVLYRELKESGHKLSTIVEREVNTDFLSAYPHVS